MALLKQTTAALGSGQNDKAFSLCREVKYLWNFFWN